MTLSKKTSLGTISVSDLFFAQIIADSLQQEACAGKAWPSTRRGRQIGSEQKINIGDLAGHIEVNPSMDTEAIDLEFSIITKFGTSIRKLTDNIADYIADTVYEKQGARPNQIKIRITGVKSRQTARRELEVIKNYAVK